MASLDTIINSNREKRAEESCIIEHFKDMMESDKEDCIIEKMMKMDNIPLDSGLGVDGDPFFNKMDDMPDPIPEEVERILESDKDVITFDDMIGIDEYGEKVF